MRCLFSTICLKMKPRANIFFRSFLSFSKEVQYSAFFRRPLRLSRFLQVQPASVEDKRLLVAVVAFLNVYFREEGAEAASAAEDGDLHWMLELLLDQVRPIAATWARGMNTVGSWLCCSSAISHHESELE